MFTPRLAPRRQPSWEVVTSQAVLPHSSPFEEEFEVEVEIADPQVLTRSYIFELPKQHSMPSTEDARRAVRRARERFLQELAVRHEYCAPLAEGWKLTILRRLHHYRIEVDYVARLGQGTDGARLQREGLPPYLEVIDSRTW